MTHQLLTHQPTGIDLQTTFPLLRLLNPKQHTWPVLVLLVLGLVVAYTTVALGIFPVWMATALVLVILMPAGILKWRDDRVRYGTTDHDSLHFGCGAGTPHSRAPGPVAPI